MDKIKENKNIVFESIKKNVLYDLLCPQCGKSSTFSGYLSSDIVICPCCGKEFLVDFKRI